MQSISKSDGIRLCVINGFIEFVFFCLSLFFLEHAHIRKKPQSESNRINTQNQSKQNSIGKGDVFGDQFWKIQTVGQSSANVRALTYCDLHTIKRDKLLEVLAFYKAFALSFARNLTLTYNLRHRFVFRKVADLKREKELADRISDEPQVAANQDHIVRKIFSKFRRQPTTQGSRDSASQSDAEKGETQTERSKVSVSRRLELMVDKFPFQHK